MTEQGDTAMFMLDRRPSERRTEATAQTLPPSIRKRPREKIALIGNFLPRLCGIATFTTHVHAALDAMPQGPSVDVYAMVDPGRIYDFPSAVVMGIEQEKRDSYRAAAARIEASGADLVWVQHEYGIFGGATGVYLLDLLDQVSAPVVATLHTVLKEPNEEQRRVLERLAARASVLIVMAQSARSLLHKVYNVPLSKTAVIEHGVPDCRYEAPSAARRRFAVEDRKTIMTFGLLSPDKGIETMIRAMPTILARCPDTVYRIVGATHPHLLAREGERHREALQRLAREIGVDGSLRWDNAFLDERQLLDRLTTADVYVTPSRNPQQITSGTLAYAAAMGKPIVATPYVHATELLADGRGILVDFEDPEGLADAVIALLTDPAHNARVARRAHAYSRRLTWARLAERAVMLFERAGAYRPIPRARLSAEGGKPGFTRPSPAAPSQGLKWGSFDRATAERVAKQTSADAALESR